VVCDRTVTTLITITITIIITITISIVITITIAITTHTVVWGMEHDKTAAVRRFIQQQGVCVCM
jgi:hypothetical protein